MQAYKDTFFDLRTETVCEPFDTDHIKNHYRA